MHDKKCKNKTENVNTPYAPVLFAAFLVKKTFSKTKNMKKQTKTKKKQTNKKSQTTTILL